MSSNRPISEYVINKELEKQLFMYVECAAVDKIEPLLKNGADANKEIKGVSPLHLASEVGFTEIAEILLKHGADVNKENKGDAPLLTACQNGRVDIVKILLRYRADVNKPNADGVTPLLMACRKGHAEIVEILLKMERMQIKELMELPHYILL